MMWYAMAKLGVWPAASVVKVDDTAPGIGEGKAAGTWTIGIALTGNAVGLSAEELAALSDAERTRYRERAAVELRDADMVIDSIADLPQAVAAIDARLAAGERPIAESRRTDLRDVDHIACCHVRAAGRRHRDDVAVTLHRDPARLGFGGLLRFLDHVGGNIPP